MKKTPSPPKLAPDEARAKFLYEAARLSETLTREVDGWRKRLLEHHGFTKESIIDGLVDQAAAREQAFDIVTVSSEGRRRFPAGEKLEETGLFEDSLASGVNPPFGWQFLVAFDDLSKPWVDAPSRARNVFRRAQKLPTYEVSGLRDASSELNAWIAGKSQGLAAQFPGFWNYFRANDTTAAALFFIDFEAASPKEIREAFAEWLDRAFAQKGRPFAQKRRHQSRRLDCGDAGFDLGIAASIVAEANLIFRHAKGTKASDLVAALRYLVATGQATQITEKALKRSLRFAADVAQWASGQGEIPKLRA